MNKILIIGICASIFILGCENQVKNTTGKQNVMQIIEEKNETKIESMNPLENLEKLNLKLP